MRPRSLTSTAAFVLLCCAVILFGATAYVCRGVITRSASQTIEDEAVWDRAHQKYYDRDLTPAERERMFEP